MYVRWFCVLYALAIDDDDGHHEDIVEGGVAPVYCMPSWHDCNFKGLVQSDCSGWYSSRLIA